LNQYKVLIVDDEIGILNFLKSKLKADGYNVITAGDGVEAIDKVHAHMPDLIVLDIVMPRMGGLTFLKELRLFSKVPVIILSAKDADDDKIEGLRLGADDYLTKPFSPRELVARIEAVRRRVSSSNMDQVLETFVCGDILIDFGHHLVKVKGEEIYLTRIEWLLLSELVQNANRVISYEELLSRIWGPDYRSDTQILRTWISRLRNKLEENSSYPKVIETVPKLGYIFKQVSST
jgi:DNA-binding response OmpR family regulator